jgi:hypothetical protein
MNKYIRNRLREDVNAFQTQTRDKYEVLEQDVAQLVEKHKEAFAHYPNDTYGVLEAIEQVFEGMFQRVEKR